MNKVQQIIMAKKLDWMFNDKSDDILCKQVAIERFYDTSN